MLKHTVGRLNIAPSLLLRFLCCLGDPYRAIKNQLPTRSTSVAALGRCLNLLLTSLCCISDLESNHGSTCLYQECH